MSDTPNTEANKYTADTFCGSGSKTHVVHVDFARKLERERGEAIQQLEVAQVLNSGLASKLEQYQRNLELIAEDCESWLNSESDEPSAEFIKLVAKYAREAIK
jgi:hypothetical protein